MLGGDTHTWGRGETETETVRKIKMKLYMIYKAQWRTHRSPLQFLYFKDVKMVSMRIFSI